MKYKELVLVALSYFFVVALCDKERDPGSIKKAICLMPMEESRCRADITRWFFNSTKRACQIFTWGGCKGNENNFANREECMRLCGRKFKLCHEPRDPGPCRASIPMYYYDHKARSCKPFTFGGCGGNENKFDMLKQCKVSCESGIRYCTPTDMFKTVGKRAVVKGWKDEEWFALSCKTKCRDLCISHHPWGTCRAYSIQKRWWGCNCYLFDREISKDEFLPGTKGVTKNRVCVNIVSTNHEDLDV